MFDRGQLKRKARKSLQGNYFKTILVLILAGLLVGIAGEATAAMGAAGIGFIWRMAFILLVMGVVPFAMVSFFLALAKNHTKVRVDHFFRGFSQIVPSIACALWRGTWILLWGLLYFLPGVVKAYAYSQAFYILADNAQIGAGDAVKISLRITEDYKWELFVLDLSFLGWVILGIFTFGLGFLVGYPYYQATKGQVYLFLRAEAIKKGHYTPEEFGLKNVPTAPPKPMM